MSKITIYILLILIFLGLSRGFSNKEHKLHYIKNERVYANFFYEGPLSVILVASFNKGTFIKTYYHQYKVIYAFKQPDLITVKTSRAFWEKNAKNLGLSLFRVTEEGDQSEIPMPPGALFLGDLAYGSWKHSDSGEKVWRFHIPYADFDKLLGWGNFRPSFEFYKVMNSHLEQNKVFKGLNGEFGTGGKVSKNIILHKNSTLPRNKSVFENYLQSLVRFKLQVKNP